jgi:uncharacterized membrane protein
MPMPDMQIPQANLWLLVVSIASGMIAVITYMCGIETIHEAKRAVVQRQPQHRHVVGIHHAVTEADRLPLRNQACGSTDDFAE